MKKLVGQLKYTNMAWSPDEMVRAINKYSDRYEAILINPNKEDSYSDIPITTDLSILDKVDILHLHNKWRKEEVNKYTGKKLIQYHSPPRDSYIDFGFEGLKLVIAQYHATLHEYKQMGCQLIRNSIDLELPIYSERKIIEDKVRVGFSPTQKYGRGNRSYESKGYLETEDVLKVIKSKYPNKFDYDIMYQVPYDECILRKSKCNVIIDECVTNSYHRSGLEGLALGKMTICYVGKEVQEVMKRVSGSGLIPFESVWIADLQRFLIDLVTVKGITYINQIGDRNWNWMRQYWSPRSIVKDLEKYYDSL